jgi:hypothetical protein
LILAPPRHDQITAGYTATRPFLPDSIEHERCDWIWF